MTPSSAVLLLYPTTMQGLIGALSSGIRSQSGRRWSSSSSSSSSSTIRNIRRHRWNLSSAFSSNRNQNYCSERRKSMLLVTTTNNNGSISASQNNTTSIMRCRRSVMGSSRHNRSRSSTSRRTKYHEIRARKLANIHPLQLFRIVQDVDHYAQFLPLCYHSKVDPSSITHNGQTFHAELVIGFGSLSSNYGPFTMQQSTVPSSSSSSSSLFTTRYISRVTVNPNELTISTISDGSIRRNDNDIDNDDEHNTTNMFESLSSYWKLRPYYNTSTTTTIAANNSDNNSSHIAGTEVDFKVEMGGVSDPIVAAVLNQMLYTVAETQVKAFQQRCYAVPPPTKQELEVAEHFYPTR